MKLLLTALLLSSCTQIPLRTRLLNSKQFRVNTYQTGIKCPNDYYYSFKDQLCHKHTVSAESSISGVSIDSVSSYQSSPSRVLRVKPVKRLKRAKKQLKIDCKSVYEQVNKCMGGR